MPATPPPAPTTGSAFMRLLLTSALVGATLPLVINALQLGMDRLLE